VNLKDTNYENEIDNINLQTDLDDVQEIQQGRNWNQKKVCQRCGGFAKAVMLEVP